MRDNETSKVKERFNPIMDMAKVTKDSFMMFVGSPGFIEHIFSRFMNACFRGGYLHCMMRVYLDDSDRMDRVCVWCEEYVRGIEIKRTYNKI